jgi:hypothetical protein
MQQEFIAGDSALSTVSVDKNISFLMKKFSWKREIWVKNNQVGQKNNVHKEDLYYEQRTEIKWQMKNKCPVHSLHIWPPEVKSTALLWDTGHQSPRDAVLCYRR